MITATQNNIWSIGHSNRAIEEFLALLSSFQIEVLVDVRSYPGSKWLPHFNKRELSVALQGANIAYIHIPSLGGRIHNQHQPLDNARQGPFQSYKSYMATNSFRAGIKQLEDIAIKNSVAYMCAEASWRNCHRSMISEYMHAAGWQVWHIKDIENAEAHSKSVFPGTIQGTLFP